MRVTRGFVAKNRRKRVLKLAKGFRGAHSSQYRAAQQTLLKALSLAYIHRKLKKRNFRSLWIRRISNSLKLLTDVRDNFDKKAKIQDQGSSPTSYSSFIEGLKKSQNLLNRKVLSQLAIFDPTSFQILVHCTQR